MNYLSLIVQIGLIIFLLVIAFFLFRMSNTIRKDKRINRFSIEALTEKPKSLFDKLDNIYNNILNSLSKKLKKIKSFNKYSLKYEKYIEKHEKSKKDPMDFVSNKIIISILAIIITIISNAFRLRPFTFLQILFSLLFGFYLPDMFLILKEKRKHKQIENDLLKAVIIMNNAFKSGRSIMQAVEVVSNELTGPISEEFRKMHIDLNYGLDLEVVFERFSKRVDLEEVKYMASSLVILNKTGGNVVEVFSSIERSFIERKKLNDELKSQTSLSNFVFRILSVIPFMIFILVYFFNDDYFKPLFTTSIGRIILVIILVIYISYIIIVKRITRLKE